MLAYPSSLSCPELPCLAFFFFFFGPELGGIESHLDISNHSRSFTKWTPCMDGGAIELWTQIFTFCICCPHPQSKGETDGQMDEGWGLGSSEEFLSFVPFISSSSEALSYSTALCVSLFNCNLSKLGRTRWPLEEVLTSLSVIVHQWNGANAVSIIAGAKTQQTAQHRQILFSVNSSWESLITNYYYYLARLCPHCCTSDLTLAL